MNRPITISNDDNNDTKKVIYDTPNNIDVCIYKCIYKCIKIEDIKNEKDCIEVCIKNLYMNKNNDYNYSRFFK
jgi:hypothetical protein